MSERVGGWIQTYSGRPFWPLDPRPEEIDVKDVAHALSNQCRYSGHVLTFLSVAEHSVIVSRIVPEEHALWGLLHDASEAYLVDLPRPLKELPDFGAAYRAAEERLMRAVCQRFGLPEEMPEAVKVADHAILANEKRDMMGWCSKSWQPLPPPVPGIVVQGWSPPFCESRFLARYRELTE